MNSVVSYITHFYFHIAYKSYDMASAVYSVSFQYLNAMNQVDNLSLSSVVDDLRCCFLLAD